ncbi:putative ATP-grasp-modified RiPP [Amycolatopsis sp. cg5]|uniref:putative ATP-grasp-modified RiPP n=1 Tax=Amycolatopsis sp. cg5 TaxID=3238802 RepID=UPI003523B390
MTSFIDGEPLSADLGRAGDRANGPCSSAPSFATTPIVLRVRHSAPGPERPRYVYDGERQIATDLLGRPLAPTLAKDWTSYESTHTDGDGGDNETWGWEEQQKK